MNKKIIVTAFLLAAGLFATRNAQAQRTYEEMERLTVNEQVTTVITATEPVRFVDISTDKVGEPKLVQEVTDSAMAAQPMVRMEVAFMMFL